MKKSWAALERGEPGSRFRDQYERQRRDKQSKVGRILRISAGILLMPVGLFFLAVPGPGLIMIALGALLIARELRFAAVALDGIEVRGRRTWHWSRRRWRRLERERRSVTR